MGSWLTMFAATLLTLEEDHLARPAVGRQHNRLWHAQRSVCSVLLQLAETEAQ